MSVNPETTMKKIYMGWAVLSTVLLAAPALAGVNDDPLLTKLTIDQLELRNGSSEDPLAWEIQGWAGYDLNKFTFKTKGEKVDGKTENAELQLLYSKAIAPYWDLQMGVKRDFYPRPGENWAVIGLQGTAPYFFETDVSLFVGESGKTALRLASEYEMMLSQQWVLSPSAEVNFNAQNDSERGAGSGLSDVELGLRLRYEVRREFAPYVGVNWEKKFGKTADFSREEGESSSDTQIVFGVQAWF